MYAMPVPYCGAAPLPGTLLERFNLDPVLLVALALLAGIHCLRVIGTRDRVLVVGGWAIAALALVSPLCALSVSLFSARIAQHMALVLIAAPLLALAGREGRREHGRLRMWAATTLFFVALWFWHMPGPYNATFASTAVYWTMHISLFGSAVWLWREILLCERTLAMEAIAAGVLTSMQMGLLGAVLTLAVRPWFFWHLTTTQVWGLTPLQDQQLGGVFMWVPGIALFLWAALRTLERVRLTLHASDTR
jgi:putative membrane protein